MTKISDIYGGELDPVAPEWVSLQQAHAIVAAIVGNEADDPRWFPMIMKNVAWRAKEGEQSEDGELQALYGLEVDARGLRALLGASRFMQ